MRIIGIEACLVLVILLGVGAAQTVTLMVPPDTGSNTDVKEVNVMTDGVVEADFNYQPSCSCSMKPLYVYEQSTALHQDYFISITNVSDQASVTLTSKYPSFSGTISDSICQQNCLLSVKNNCPTGEKYRINMFTVQIQGAPSFSYMVNCNPSVVYKPFEWGLFLIIIFAILIVTVSSVYNKAASFNNYFIKINYRIILALNLVLFACGVLTYLKVPYFPLIVNISGSIAGTVAVYIITNEIIWMFNSKVNKKQVWKSIRVLDLISISVAMVMFIIYWSTSSSWIVSDIMSVSLTVASIKIFRIKSLKIATVFLLSVILLETITGLVIHYLLKVSYNNFIINDFNNPFFLQLPSITPELYRKCAWLPALTIIQPGLVISYLRRFDVSRSTWVYLLIGYVSQYVGSFAWMLIDSSTVHTLPLGLICDPLMLIIVVIFAFRRNENRQLWLGLFHDEEDTYQPRTLSSDQDIGDKKSTSMRFNQLIEGLRVSGEEI